MDSPYVRDRQERRHTARETLVRGTGLAVVFIAVALAGVMSGVLFAYSDDLPEITALDNYRPSTITRLLARDGKVIGDFATERRVVIGYDEIAPALRNAIVSVEDAGFNQHFGLSISRIVVTAVTDIMSRRRAGASTLTQQLARDVFLRDYLRDGVFERSQIGRAHV